MIHHNEKKYVCHLDLAMDMIKGKWKAVILCHLNGKNIRFLELKRQTKGISQKVLSENLSALEEHGLVHRKVYPEVPPKVEYSLTKKGEDLFPALEHLQQWAIKYY